MRIFADDGKSKSVDGKQPDCPEDSNRDAKGQAESNEASYTEIQAAKDGEDVSGVDEMLSRLAQAVLEAKQNAQSETQNRAKGKTQADAVADRENEAIGGRPGDNPKWSARSAEQVVGEIEAAE